MVRLLVLTTLLPLASGAGFADGEVCLAHADCSATSFCKVGECSTRDGAAMLCGKCSGCSQCRCSSQAVDNAWPAHCAATSNATADSLQGRYIATAIQALSRRYGDAEGLFEEGEVMRGRDFFFFTLVTGPRRSLSLKLSDTKVYKP